jgi:phage recombination protein Bet
MGDIAKIENKTSLLAKFASRYDVEPQKMLATLKATVFKGDISNEQMIALLAVADQHGLNPFLKEIYAFPDKGGIVPVVGVDGWSRILNEQPQFDGIEFVQDDEKCTAIIHRKDRSHPVKVTEYLAECKRETAPWKSHPRRMLRHKAMIQAARLAFGFTGIYDPDEAERIRESRVIDITPTRDDVADLNTELGLLTDGTDERPTEE